LYKAFLNNNVNVNSNLNNNFNINSNLNNNFNVNSNLSNNFNVNSNEILNLKNQLNYANNKIIQLESKINELESIKNNNFYFIQSLQNTINQKDKELMSLKMELQNKNIINIPNKQLFSLDQMICVNFVSMDARVHYAIPCVGNNIFAEIEEKLYKKYPEYRETNNIFLANGKQVLRFKTIDENNIGNGLPITLVVPTN